MSRVIMTSNVSINSQKFIGKIIFFKQISIFVSQQLTDILYVFILLVQIKKKIILNFFFFSLFRMNFFYEYKYDFIMKVDFVQ